MYLTLNSQFKPFTYDELVKPLQDYGEAYREVEEQYNDLAQQTEAWKNIATQENSPEAYAMYKKYADELNAVVSDFSRGMTIQNRGKLSGLKTRYASEITPISNAYTALTNANAFRDEMRAKDDSVVFNVDRYTSLDDFLNGQMVDNSFISGRTLQADIAAQTLTNSYNKYNELVAAGHNKKAAAKMVAQGDWIDEDSMLSGIYDNAGITTEEAAAKIRNYTDNGIAQGITAFSTNIEQTFLQEQASRARYNVGPRTPTFNMDDTLLALYDALGFAQSEDRSVTTRTVVDEGTPYEKVSNSTKTESVRLTDQEKLAAARNNPDLLYAAGLMESGLKLVDVLSQYTKYSDLYHKDNQKYASVIPTFADYAGLYAAWGAQRANYPGYVTFDAVLDELLTSQNEDDSESEE